MAVFEYSMWRVITSMVASCSPAVLKPEKKETELEFQQTISVRPVVSVVHKLAQWMEKHYGRPWSSYVFNVKKYIFLADSDTNLYTGITKA